MKILLVHNYYGSGAPSGENAAFDMERDLLSQHGHEVVELTRHSDSIIRKPVLGTLKAALATPWNPFAASQVKRLLEKQGFDVMHVHNTFPLISPSIFHAAHGIVPRVLTLHNYRLFCPAAIPMRSGKVCTECMDRRSVTPALRYGCYRNSHIATTPLAISVGLHRTLGTWTREVDAFVALTRFQKEKMQEAGLPWEKVYVKPNFYPGFPEVRPWHERERQVVCVGRMSEEKGVSELLDAWLKWGSDAPPLIFVGDGPLRGQLESLAARNGAKNVRFVGQVAAGRAQELISLSRLLVVPSKCFEGFPMTLREGFAFGTPCVVSDLGPLPDLVRSCGAGAVARAGDVSNLFEVISGLWPDEQSLERMSRSARREYESKYNETSNYHTLRDIYRSARETWKSRFPQVAA